MTFLLALSAAAGTAGAGLAAKFASRLSLLDVPNGRSSHGSPTPRAGGVGIVAAFAVAGVVLGAPASFVVPGALLALIGLYDDVKSVGPKTRLALQIIAAAVAVRGLALPPAAAATAARVSTTSSTIVFQASQPGHWPMGLAAE